MMKTLNKVEIEENFLRLTKSILQTPTANIMLSDEKLDTFSPGSGTKQRCPCSPFLFCIVLETQNRATREEKILKSSNLGEGEK